MRHFASTNETKPTTIAEELAQQNAEFIAQEYQVPIDLAALAIKMFHGPLMTMIKLDALREEDPDLTEFISHFGRASRKMREVERAGAYLRSRGYHLAPGRLIDLVLMHNEAIYHPDFSVLGALHQMEVQSIPPQEIRMRETHEHEYSDSPGRDVAEVSVRAGSDDDMVYCPRDDEPCVGSTCQKKERPLACLPTLERSIGNYLGTRTFAPRREFENVGNDPAENYVLTKLEKELI